MKQPLIDYKGPVDPTPLQPKICSSYKILDNFSEIVDLIQNWQYQTAYNKLEDLKKTSNSVEVYTCQAEMLLELNRFEDAGDTLSEAFSNGFNKDKQVLFLLAYVNYALGDIDKVNYYVNLLKEVSRELAEVFNDIRTFRDTYYSKNDFELDIPKDAKIDAIVLYGNRMEEDSSMSAALRSRLLKTLELAEKYPEADILASGGAALTPFSEADAMVEFLLENGIDRDRIYMDSVAHDTIGNNLGFIRLLDEFNLAYDNFCLVTSLSHLPRCFMSFTKAFEYRKIKYSNIYACSPEEAGSIEIPDHEIFYGYYTLFASAGFIQRDDFY